MEVPYIPDNLFTSEENKLFSKRNIISFLAVGILLLAVPVGVNLVQKQQLLKTRAATGAPISFVANDSTNCDANGDCTTTSTTVDIELRSPLGPPGVILPTQSPTPTLPAGATVTPVTSTAPRSLKQECIAGGTSVFSWVEPAGGVVPTAYSVRVNKLADVWWPSDTSMSGDFVAGPTGTTYNADIASDIDYAWSVQAYPFTSTAPRRTEGGRFTCTSAGAKIQVTEPNSGQADSPTNLTVNCGAGGKSASFIWTAPATGEMPSQYTLRVDKNQDVWFPTRTDVSGDFVAGVTSKSYTANVAVGADYAWSVQVQPNNGTSTDRRTEGETFKCQ